jgi:hypothetical protein
MGNNGRSNGGLGHVSGEIFGPRRKTMTWTDRWGPHVRERRRSEGYRFGIFFLGRGLIQMLGRFVAPGPLSRFFFFFPSFSFSVSYFFHNYFILAPN